MRIQLISQLFDPENSIKGLAFVRRLQALGHEVEVVTTFPSYPGGKLYAGYRQRAIDIDTCAGLRIVRLATFMSHGQSAAKRVLSYGSFCVVAGLYCLVRGRRADVVYAYYPPVFVGLAALAIGKIRGTPFVYDVQDLWPDALVATGAIRAGGAAWRLIAWLCTVVYRGAARIVVQSYGYRDALLARQVPSTKLRCIFNWCDESRMAADADAPAPGMDDCFFNILYAGNLGAAQALEHVLDAAHLLQKNGETKVRFVFLGNGVAEEALKRQAASLGLVNVQFLQRVTADEVGGYLAAADALLVHLADEPVFENTIPQKTQAYLRAGRPILMAARGEAAAIVRQAGAGLVAEPCRPEQLAQAALTLSRLDAGELYRMATCARTYYEDNMSMAIGIRAIEAVLEEATAV